MATIPEVKTAIVELLGETLPQGPEGVAVLYSQEEAEGRKVIVGDASTVYNTARMRADSTLLRYDLTYSVDIVCHSGPNLETPQIAETQAYELLDLVLTPLVRGDATGRSLLADRLPSIVEVVPSTDSRMVSWDDNANREVVLGLTLNIKTRRD